MRVLFVLALFLICAIDTNFAQAQSFMTESERDAMADISAGKYITARNKAEALLRESPDSPGANFVMGQVFWEGEGNLLRAMVLMKKAISLFEEKYCQTEDGRPALADNRTWHQRMMLDLAQIYAELDDRPMELATRQRIADLYMNGNLGEDALWALMKLGEFDRATEIAHATLRDATMSAWAGAAYNDLTAISDAQHKHTESYEASVRSVEFHGGKSCVVLMNHGRSLSFMLRFDEAVEYYLKATKAPGKDCTSEPPYFDLSSVYLLDGAWQKAVSAILNARKFPGEPRFAPAREAQTRAKTADVFFAMGFPEKAWVLFKTVVEAPMRLGYNSLLKDQLDLANAVVYLAISQDYLRRLDEHIGAWTSFGFMHRFDGLSKFDVFGLFASDDSRRVYELMRTRDDVRRRLWSTHQGIFKKCLNEKNLMSFIIPMYVIPPQYHYALVDAIGLRTAEFLVDFQESILTPQERDTLTPVFAHFRAYVAWRSGQDDAALSQLDAFDQTVRPRMTLLAQQARLMRADILMRRGEPSRAFDEMVQVYTAFPSAFRHFDVRLPVNFEANAQNAHVAKALDILRDSPRLQETDAAPFVVSVTAEGETVQICLSSRLGQRYACSSTDGKDYDISDTHTIPIPEVVNHFYHAAFAPRVDLSQADLHSLDGSPTTVTADEALQDLLKTSNRSLRIEDTSSDDL